MKTTCPSAPLQGGLIVAISALLMFWQLGCDIYHKPIAKVQPSQEPSRDQPETADMPGLTDNELIASVTALVDRKGASIVLKGLPVNTNRIYQKSVYQEPLAHPCDLMIEIASGWTSMAPILTNAGEGVNAEWMLPATSVKLPKELRVTWGNDTPILNVGPRDSISIKHDPIPNMEIVYVVVTRQVRLYISCDAMPKRMIGYSTEYDYVLVGVSVTPSGIESDQLIGLPEGTRHAG